MWFFPVFNSAWNYVTLNRSPNHVSKFFVLLQMIKLRMNKLTVCRKIFFYKKQLGSIWKHNLDGLLSVFFILYNIQWGSEFWISLVFRWWKEAEFQMVWYSNAIWLPVRVWPFEYRTNGRHFFSYVLVWHFNGQSSTYDIIQKRPF